MCVCGGGGVTAYIVVYRDVRKIWVGFLDSNYKMGVACILAKIYKHVSLILYFETLKYRFGCQILLLKIINMGLKIIL